MEDSNTKSPLKQAGVDTHVSDSIDKGEEQEEGISYYTPVPLY